MISRVERVVQESSHNRRITRRFQHITCGRCHAVIEYGRGTGWSVVNELVNEHWKACPRKPHATPAHMARTPTSPPATEIVLPPPVAPEQGSSSTVVVEAAVSPYHPWIPLGCERKRRTREQRKLELEQDEYARNVTPKSVVCRGCHKEISLDKRSLYYPGLWLKHRAKCPSIEKLERAKTRVQQALDGTRQMACDVDSSSFDDNVYAEVQQLSPAERYQCHSVATTQRSLRYYDSDYPSSSGDESEGDDSLSHESFPTLNYAFYWTQQREDRADEWVYRYATEDEITTNFFRGQDEPYARPSGRSCMQLALGDHCETSRCAINDQAEQEASPYPAKFWELSEPHKTIASHTTYPFVNHLLN